MPYLHCYSCRLTIFKPHAQMHGPASRECPSCGAPLRDKPRSLFESRFTARVAAAREAPPGERSDARLKSR